MSLLVRCDNVARYDVSMFPLVLESARGDKGVKSVHMPMMATKRDLAMTMSYAIMIRDHKETEILVRL